MGSSAANSVTDTNGRFHHVGNAFCADQSLFVTVGSVNPTLTGLVLARKVAQAAVALSTGAQPPP
jgi:choline dehydrogenase-like flavoprotein